MLALMGQEKFTDVKNAEEVPELPIALGVIRDVEAETYNEAVNKQIDDIHTTAKAQNFDALTQTLEHWEM